MKYKVTTKDKQWTMAEGLSEAELIAYHKDIENSTARLDRLYFNDAGQMVLVHDHQINWEPGNEEFTYSIETLENLY